MIAHFRKIASLMSGLFLLLVGHGLISTLLGVAGARAGFSSSELGLIMGGYFVGFIAGSRVTPQLIGRVGHVRYFAAMASATSAVIILHGLILDVWVWTVFRAICGFCMVGIYVAVESWLNQQAEPAKRGGVFAIYMTVSMLAMAVGQGLLVLPVDQLALFALISILYSLGVIPIALTRQPEPQLSSAPPVSLGVLWAVSPMGVAGTLAAGLIHSAFYGLAAVYAVARGLDEASIALFVGSAIFGGALSLFGVGRWSDYRDRRRTLIFILLLTSLSAPAMLAAGSNALISALSGLVYGAVAFNIYSLSAAHLHDHLESGQMLAATSRLQTIYGVGSVFGPLLVGLLMARFGPVAFVAWITAVALWAGLFGLYRTTRTPPIAPVAQSERLAARMPSLVSEAAAAGQLEDPAPVVVPGEPPPER